MSAERKLMTLAEAAALLNLDKVARKPAEVVRRLVYRGELQGVRVAKYLMVTRASVMRLCGDPEPTAVE